MSSGTSAITGGVVSRTVTLKLAVALLPAASLAVTSTVVSPSGNVEAEDGSAVAVTGPSTASLADTENVTGAPPAPVASSVMSAGTESWGASCRRWSASWWLSTRARRGRSREG